MRPVLAALFLSLLLVPPLGAQEPAAPPVDEAEENAGFATFRAALLDAVVARDIEAILAMTAEDVTLSFGGAEGRAALRAFLEVDPEQFGPERRFEAPAMRARNWADLETVLRMGGVFDSEGRFVAPYTFSVAVPEGMDPFEVLLVTGSGVALRDRPIRYGEVLGWLDYAVVRQVEWAAGTSYVKVETRPEPDPEPDSEADGGEDTGAEEPATPALQGFVHRDYLRALLDYRAIFEQRDGAWKMVVFIAGD